MTVAPSNMVFSEITNDIRVSVVPIFLEDHSEPDDHQFVWAYQVTIENNGSNIVQLVNRYWHITDSYGRVQEVRGAGVVGEQPVLKPGDAFQYTSGTSLKTASGIMLGNYEMLNQQNQEIFLINIPAFSLDLPIHKGREKITIN